MSSPCSTPIIREKGYERLKWVLDALESGAREINDLNSFESGVLSVGGEHIGWQGQWLLDSPRLVSPEFFHSMKTGRIREGDVLLVKDGATIGKVAIADPPPANQAAVNEHVFILRVGKDHHPRFYFYVMQSPLTQSQIQLEVRGSAQPGLNAEFRNVVTVPVPSYLQQRAIADYLDHETARIDALTEAKERLLGLLAEKRRALITHAVSCGLDPNTQLRASGIPWLGKIPIHWKVTRLKFTGRVQTGLALGKRYQVHSVVEYPYLRVANVQDGFLDLSDVKTVSVPELEAHSYLLRKGDVLMNEGGDADKLGRGAVWTGEIDPCLHQNHVFAVRVRDISSAWLALWTSSDYAKAYFESRSKQSTNLASISATNLLEMPLLQPPKKEQSDIVDAVHDDIRKIDAMSSAIEDTVNLFKERRSSLIAAAVTGLIDVGIAT